MIWLFALGLVTRGMQKGAVTRDQKLGTSGVPSSARLSGVKKCCTVHVYEYVSL